jgi:hypothetical protein
MFFLRASLLSEREVVFDFSGLEKPGSWVKFFCVVREEKKFESGGVQMSASWFRRLLTGVALLSLAGAVCAEEFTATLTVTGAANAETLVLGMDDAATDGFDNTEDVEDIMSPPSPPSLINYAGFAKGDYYMLKDIRATATEKTWTIVVSVMSGSVTFAWPDNSTFDGTLRMSGVGLSDGGVDLKTAGNHTVSTSGTLVISYGKEPETVGSLTLTTTPSNGQWRLLSADGEPVVDKDGDDVSGTNDDPAWISGVGGSQSTIANLNTGDYLVRFADIDASYTTPDDMNVTINGDEARSATYTRIAGEISVAPMAITTTEDGGSSQVAVVLTAEPTDDVIVTPSLAGDYPEAATLSSALTFTAANWNVAQSITVTGADDAVANDNGGRAYQVDLAVTSDDDRYDGYALTAVSGVTIDNDFAALVISPMAGLKTTETDGQATFEVVLNSQPTADVTLTITSSDTGEGTVDQDTLTFTTENWDMKQTVTVIGVDDESDDGDVPYKVYVRSASDDDDYDGFVKVVKLTNEDDDATVVEDTDPLLNLVVLPDSYLDFGQLYEGGDSVQQTVTLYNRNTEEVTLTNTITGDTDAFAFKATSSSTITLAAGKAKTFKIVAIPQTAGDTSEAALNITTAAGTSTKTLLLQSATMAVPTGGVLSVEPALIVVDNSGDTESVSFDLELDCDVHFSRMLVKLQVPTFVTVTQVETNTDVTSGWNFVWSRDDDGLMTLFYMDPFFDATADDPGGVDTGEVTLLTITGTVDTSDASLEDEIESISFVDVTAYSGTTPYILTWETEAPTRGDSDEAIGVQDGAIAISSKITLADLDITGDGSVTMTDLIIVYRWLISSITKNDESQITPDSWGASDEQKAAFKSAVLDLEDKLDISEDGGVTMTDIILIYRWAVSSITKGEVEEITPESWGATSEQNTLFSENVVDILPSE